MRPVLRPDLQTAAVTPDGARIITHVLSRPALDAWLRGNNASPELWRTSMDAWDALYTTANLSKALDRAADVLSHAPAAPAPQAPAQGAPLSAEQAAEILEVSSRRVRQLAAEGELSTAPHPGRRVMVTRESVDAYVARKLTEKSRITGRDLADRRDKAA